MLVKRSAAAWIDDYAPSMGAALSYYTVFSLAPLLLIVVFVWVYFSAQIFLVGAEFTWIYARRFGSMKQLEAAAHEVFVKPPEIPSVHEQREP